MARNPKRGTVELRWQRLLAVMALVIGFASLTVGYVLQRRAHDELGRQIEAVEKDLRWMEGRIREASIQLERCRSRGALLSRAAEMGLGLVDIVPSQRLTVPLLEEGEESPAGMPIPGSPVLPANAASAAPRAPLATAGSLGSSRSPRSTR